MVRASILKQINSILEENEHFSYNDFKIITSQEYDSTVVKIEYEFKKECYCELNLPQKASFLTREEKTETRFMRSNTKIEEYQNYVLKGEISPGALAKVETIERHGVTSYRQVIVAWLNYLWQDLIDEPLNRLFIKQKSEIEKIKNRLNFLPEDFFSEEEEETIIQRLNDLEKQFKNQIKNSFEDKKEQEKKIKELKKEIEKLKLIIGSIDKRSWFKSFATKTLSWLAKPENQKLLKSGKSLVQSLLPENGTQ
ncbi:hypothetical protein [uncultured Roseivirga sp.]|uniref:hypothetical protein n=1 Tax=uncultured Roseivirga sp. TaxID=543088 RepID=UPI000D7A78AD|nr:hypothetical protein [uncultured Roseivirga sp.]PWL29342.1 MAG: hypothetical protein DCO95_12975 [Roseivirga sp. XM-24bin3]